MNDYEIYEKALKYDKLVDYLFSKSHLSWNSEIIGIDHDDFSNIMQILEPEMHACKLENLKVKGKVGRE